MKIVALLGWALSALDGSARSKAPVVAERNPVILVHGIYSSSDDMQRMAQLLRTEGWEVHTPTLTPAGGQLPLEELAVQLSAFIHRKVGGRKFDLVGFSMGGLVSRYWVQRMGGLERVERFITLASPHQGTRMAELMRSPGARQMRQGSEFLQDLASDAEVLRSLKFTSIYTPLDTIIVPARSSEMPQARNIRLWAAMHPSLILEARCARMVADALRE